MKASAIYAICAVSVTAAAFCYIASNESKYDRSAVCVASYQGEHTFEDKGGNLWGYDTDTELFEVGAEYILKMDDNHTPAYIYDDKIIFPKRA